MLTMKATKIVRRIDDLGRVVIPKEIIRMQELQDVQETKTRVIDGSIAADGKILEGTGFTVIHEHIGVYIVKFNDPFYFSAPQIAKIEVLNPYIEPYGYKVEIIGSVTTSQFKYFTYEIKDHDLVMKDLELNYFYAWGYEEPNE